MNRLWIAFACLACTTPPVTAPTAREVVIDRFSAAAGHLQVRDAKHPLPGPNEPIDLDRPPFVTQGLAPDGRPVRYYNFDVQSPMPANRYRFTRPGERKAIPEYNDLVDVLPGDPGYSDFWRIVWVELPVNAPPITSTAELASFTREPSNTIVNCPVVPRGTTAREGSPTHDELWYRGARVMCLGFGPPLEGAQVPSSPIYVTFASETGPASGFATEPATPQTHNVVGSLPGDFDYSPLWDVHVYARASFAEVRDLRTAQAAPLATKGPLVNCPIVFVAPAP